MTGTKTMYTPEYCKECADYAINFDKSTPQMAKEPGLDDNTCRVE